MSEVLLMCPFCGGSVSVVPCCHLDEYTDESSYSWAIAHNDFNIGCWCSLNLPGETEAAFSSSMEHTSITIGRWHSSECRRLFFCSKRVKKAHVIVSNLKLSDTYRKIK